MSTPRLLYLLNSFDAGGAEDAPARLIAGGAFEGVSVEVLALVRGQGRQIEAIRDLGGYADALFPDQRMRLDHLPRAALALSRRFADYDAVLLSLPQANIVGRLVAGSLPKRRRPLILSFEHNSHLAKRAYEAGFRMTSACVDWRLADCAETARQAQARLYGQTPARQSVLPLVQFDSAASPPSRPPGAVLELISAGRLTTTKNHQALIAAMDRLRSLGRPVRLTIYGDGPCRSALEAQTAALGLGDAVRFAGHTAGWQHHPADIFLLPSRHEGLCIAALEAMAAGIPVIATKVGGLVDYGAGAAVLLDSAEPDAVVQAIVDLADDPERAARLRTAALKVAREDYGTSAVRAAYADFNRELLEVLARRQG